VEHGLNLNHSYNLLTCEAGGKMLK